MAAEIYVRFRDLLQYRSQKKEIEYWICHLATFVDKQKNAWWCSQPNRNENEFWLLGMESVDNPNYDVRFFTRYEDYILVEVTYSPKSIAQSLTTFFDFVKSNFDVSIEDEDGLEW